MTILVLSEKSTAAPKSEPFHLTERTVLTFCLQHIKLGSGERERKKTERERERKGISVRFEKKTRERVGERGEQNRFFRHHHRQFYFRLLITVLFFRFPEQFRGVVRGEREKRDKERERDRRKTFCSVFFTTFTCKNERKTFLSLFPFLLALARSLFLSIPIAWQRQQRHAAGGGRGEVPLAPPRRQLASSFSSSPPPPRQRRRRSSLSRREATETASASAPSQTPPRPPTASPRSTPG